MLTPAQLDCWPEVQRGLIAVGAPLIKPGGRLVYATCTVLPAENDEVASSCALPALVQRTLLPHVEGRDGFLVRSSGAATQVIDFADPPTGYIEPSSS